MNAADLSNDADPAFLAEFYKNLKILSQDLFKRSAAAGPSPVASSSGSVSSFERRTSAPVARSPSRRISSFSDALAEEGERDFAVPALSSHAFSAPPSEYFSHENISERMRVYIREGGIPQEFVERYATEARARRQQRLPLSPLGGGGGAPAGGGGPGGHADAEDLEDEEKYEM